jgi:bifunctional DNase/RNase
MPHIKVEFDSIRRPQLEKLKGKATLILKEDSPERYLPVAISSEQADILTKELTSDLSVELRSAPSLFLSSVNASPSDIVCVTIHFDNDVYYAKVLLYLKDEPLDVKCPICIALSLAYRTKVPILVDSEIMGKWSLTSHCDWTWGAADAIIKAAAEI